jgi:hypothetical protein
MATLILKNNTAGALTYASGDVTVPASGNVTVPVGYQIPAANDLTLQAAVISGTITPNNGAVDGGLNILYQFIPSLAQDSINTTTQMQSISVGTTAVAAIGAGTILAGRKLLTVCPTNGTIYWGNSSAVTVSTGFPLYQGQVRDFSFTDAVPLYIISAGTVTTLVFEGS